jgi:hypothetical protein
LSPAGDDVSGAGLCDRSRRIIAGSVRISTLRRGVQTVHPAVLNAGRRGPRVRELLMIRQAHFWRTSMELLLILPAAFFAAVLWCTGARLWRLLITAAAKRRISQMAVTGRAVSD